MKGHPSPPSRPRTALKVLVGVNVVALVVFLVATRSMGKVKKGMEGKRMPKGRGGERESGGPRMNMKREREPRRVHTSRLPASPPSLPG